MSWFLQPANWAQTKARNLYNVGYRRSGTYKGFGHLGQGIMPGENTGSGLDPAAQQAVTDLFNLYYSPASSTTPPFESTPATSSMWPSLLMIGGGLLVMVLLVKESGHR